jgi:arylsulfatase
MDFMRTFIDLAGAEYPETYNGKPIQPTTGISLVPSFSSLKTPGHEALFNEHFGARYARQGAWKLVSVSNDSTWHLYNLAVDRTETNDLAAQQPDKVRQLDSLWRQWANTHKVFPKPGKKHN